MHQCGREGEPRTPSEEVLFQAAITNLDVLYAHPYTINLMLTRLPPDYPKGYRFRVAQESVEHMPDEVRACCCCLAH